MAEDSDPAGQGTTPPRPAGAVNEHAAEPSPPPAKTFTSGIVSGILISLLVSVCGAFAVAGVAWFLYQYTDAREEVLLPILLIYGVLTLVVALGVLVGILSNFGLTQGGRALGLPEGSIQAVIALILVLIFAITAVFLSTIEIGEGGVPEQFATQILTTTGTLAVAVAGFYFGTRAVETGAAAAAGVSTRRSVSVVSPTSPSPLRKAQGENLRVSVQTIPPGASLTWTVIGDLGGQLVQLRPGEFEYTRGETPSAEVTLRFAIIDDPSASAELKVTTEPDGSSA